MHLAEKETERQRVGPSAAQDGRMADKDGYIVRHVTR